MVTIQNIAAGHGGDEGRCSAPVLLLRGASDFVVEHSLLYGSGASAAILEDVHSFRLSSSTVRDCTSASLRIHRSSDVLVEDSTIEQRACTQLTIIPKP